LSLASEWGVAPRIEILPSRDDTRVGEADIVTNTGFVRPLDAAFLGTLNPLAVVPLMFETWEYRPEDLDLAACRELGIPVLGTNERHPDLQTFGYIGHVALKLLFALDVEAFMCKILVLGSGPFAQEAATTLERAGSIVWQLDPSDTAGDSRGTVEATIREADAIVVVEHHSRERLIGPGGILSGDQLARLSDTLVLAHICGEVDEDDLRSSGLRYAPQPLAPAGHMSVGTDYVGPRPLIDLHAAGLRIGELMARERRAGGGGGEVERRVLARTDLAQGFSHEGDRAHP
jgi:hypothetical protein